MQKVNLQRGAFRKKDEIHLEKEKVRKFPEIEKEMVDTLKFSAEKIAEKLKTRIDFREKIGESTGFEEVGKNTGFYPLQILPANLRQESKELSAF